MEKQKPKTKKLNFLNQYLFNQLNKDYSRVHKIIPQPNTEPITVDKEWEKKWTALVAELKYTEDQQVASTALRKIIKTGILKFTDLRDYPERFFAAHRIMASRGIELGAGGGIRFTVQYNLFAGTILGIAGDEQLSILDKIQKKGLLGCFALTEKFAGVTSGLVVNTEIEWDNDKQYFILNTPNEGAEKNWISQGFTADMAIVIATLKVGGEDFGPHAFLMDFRDEKGNLVPNITIVDMGRKTVGNDLDNVSIHFDHVVLPKSSMLNRFADIDENGKYKIVVPGIKPFDMIGQRLFTGRICISQAASVFQGLLFKKTKEYSDNKLCWGPKGKFPALSKIPQLTELYALEAEASKKMWRYHNNIENQLNACLRNNQLPSAKLIEAIAVCKVIAVEQSQDFCFRLKQEVGSYALMDGKGFEQMDFVTMCKFAEGDSRILMLKMARDAMQRLKKVMMKGKTPPNNKETEICLNLAMGQIKKENQFKALNQLAQLIIDRYLEEFSKV